MGHVISKQGICLDPTKTEKVKNYPAPTNAMGVRQFLGLATYYRQFVLKFTLIASLLKSLTWKNAEFEWTDACEKAFCELKSALISALVLAYPQGTSASIFLDSVHLPVCETNLFPHEVS